MTTLKQAIFLKMLDCPIGYRGTPELLKRDKALFPYPNHWRGDYRCAYPMIEERRAGFRSRVDVDIERPHGIRFGLADGCFETAPSTTFPCWESGYGCKQPRCVTNCNPGPNCTSRYDFR
jgi:hypothetical protein